MSGTSLQLFYNNNNIEIFLNINIILYACMGSILYKKKFLPSD